MQALTATRPVFPMMLGAVLMFAFWPSLIALLTGFALFAAGVVLD